ncbi:MAG: RDD family protein [Solimonas sp.]
MGDLFIGRNGERLGPFTDDALRTMAAKGQLYDNDLAWYAGAAGWQPLREVLAARGLEMELNLMPPPPPPPLPKASAGPGEMGSYLSRFAAYLLDGVVGWFVMMGLYLVAGIAIVVVDGASGDEHTGFAAAAVIPTYLAYFALFAYWQGGEKRATPGKRALGLVAVTPDGRPLGFWRAYARQIVMPITLLFLLPFFVLFFTRRRQMLHDFIVGSVVVRKDSFDPASFDADRLQRPPGDGNAAIIIVVLLFGFVFIIGILAAIAIPAYQDYVTRANVSAALSEVAPLKAQIGELLSTQDHIASYADVGLEGPLQLQGNAGSADVGADGTIAISFAMRPIENKVLVLKPADGHWDCKGGDLPAKYRPSNCR